MISSINKESYILIKTKPRDFISWLLQNKRHWNEKNFNNWWRWFYWKSYVSLFVGEKIFWNLPFSLLFSLSQVSEKRQQQEPFSIWVFDVFEEKIFCDRYERERIWSDMRVVEQVRFLKLFCSMNVFITILIRSSRSKTRSRSWRRKFEDCLHDAEENIGRDRVVECRIERSFKVQYV